jgi:hypothetical protein
MSNLLEDFRTNIYKVSNSEPLAARKEHIRTYSEKYKSHCIVPSYLHTASSSQSIFKLEALKREGKGYPLTQNHAIPELHIEFDSLDQAEKQELFDALPKNRKKPH